MYKWQHGLWIYPLLSVVWLYFFIVNGIGFLIYLSKNNKNEKKLVYQPVEINDYNRPKVYSPDKKRISNIAITESNQRLNKLKQ